MDQMETMLVSGKNFKTVRDAAEWANDLVGRVVPGNSTLKITKILQFQMVPEGESFSLMLMVEIERNTSMSSMVLKMRKGMDFPKEGKEPKE